MNESEHAARAGLKLSILVPVHNEAATVRDILGKIISVGLIGGIEKEILVINNLSTDLTEKIIENFIETHPEAGIRLLNENCRKGKGAALQLGISHSTGDLIIVQDADLEYDPEDYNLLLRPIMNGEADVVYGSRFGKKTGSFSWHTFGNKFLTSLSNFFTGLHLTDMETCYKLIPSEYLKKIELLEKRFGFEPEVTAKLSKIPGIRIREVGISYKRRSYAEGKKIGIRDGFRTLWCILKYNLFSR